MKPSVVVFFLMKQVERIEKIKLMLVFQESQQLQNKYAVDRGSSECVCVFFF